MRRTTFLATAAALVAATPALPTAATAQVVAGRDLLGFPVATAGEAPALATNAGDGLWNPAAIALPDAVRWRAGVAAVDTPAAQGLGVQSAWGAASLPGPVSVGASVVRAAVRDVIRTDVDPTSHGEIAYGTTMASLTGATPLSRWVMGGVALRYRVSELGDSHHAAAGVDGGILAGGGWWHDIRLAASTVLWRPGGASGEAQYAGAADIRAVGEDSTAEARVGYQRTVSDGAGREHYVYGSLHLGPATLRGGVLATREFGDLSTRSRFGVAVRYATYYVAVARESTPIGQSGTYFFTLTTTVK